VPAAFVFLLKRPALWPLALFPIVLVSLGLPLGLLLGWYALHGVDATLAPFYSRLPEWLAVILTVVTWAGTLVAGALLGLAAALALAAPVHERLSRRVEVLSGRALPVSDRGFAWETAQALRGGLFFLVAAPAVLLFALIPLAGPVLGALWGAYALAHQLTETSLSRRGLSFVERRRWHSTWRPETLGLGLAGVITLAVPIANLLLGPALTVGGTRLVLELEQLEP
jgi:CysZ protein